jgi:hypothetical protein
VEKLSKALGDVTKHWLDRDNVPRSAAASILIDTIRAHQGNPRPPSPYARKDGEMAS